MAVVVNTSVAVFLDKVANAAEQELCMPPAVKSQLRALQSKVSMLRCFLADAERRGFYDEGIRRCLAKLRDLVYDADDVVDDYAAGGEAPPEGSPSSSSSSSRKLAFQLEIGGRIKDINARLEGICKELSLFHPVAAEEAEESEAAREMSSDEEAQFVGLAIEVHARCLIRILTEDGSREGCLVAITGMAGIGKTTLAQRIYKDDVFGATFQIKIWVCVSKQLAWIRLLRQIIQGAGVDPGDTNSRALLDTMLHALVRGKKLLLVLDDVWRADVWEYWLRTPLRSMAAGSKILVTTRFESVARQVGAGHLHHVERMPVEDGWSLLCNKAFKPSEKTEMETLKDVGFKIVEMCGGLPLAIKLIGGALKGKSKTRFEWEKILKNQVWSSSIFPGSPDGVMEALYLSYEDLPSHLKQCFQHLSLFPEDHVFVRPYVVQQWIAEGFVTAKGRRSLELEGEYYFRELVSRSLLQLELSLIDGTHCKMHDLLRSLAQSLAEGENFFGDVSEVKDGPMKLRRLSISNEGIVTDLEMLNEKEFLRSLYLQKNQHGGVILSDDVVKKLSHLRLLDLSGAEIEELPDVMRSLGHLRYLNVSDTPVRKIPEWIGDLKNLQFLLLKNCKNIRAIPTGITKLKNLRSLELFDGTEVDEMPRGIRGLVQLGKLIDYTVDKDDGSLEELGPLVNLHTLGITKLERILDKGKARSAAINSKTILRYLSLECTLPMLSKAMSQCLPPDCSEEEEMKTRIVAIFDELCPPPSLQTLNIFGYMGLNLPSWMWPTPPLDVSPLRNVTWIGLINCTYCSQLPPLGLLPYLKKLMVKGASAVACIGSELLWSPPPTSPTATASSATNTAAAAVTVLFPKLEWMILMGMPNLEDWHWETESHGIGVTAFPCLENLYIEGCPKLRSLPQGLWCGPRRLYITDCPALKEVSDFDALRLLQLEDNQMETLPPWLAQIFVDPASNSNYDYGILVLKVKSDLLKRIVCQKMRGDSVPEGDWQSIKHIHRVQATATDNESATFSYMKNFSSFSTNIEITDRISTCTTSGIDEQETKRTPAE